MEKKTEIGGARRAQAAAGPACETPFAAAGPALETSFGAAGPANETFFDATGGTGLCGLFSELP